MLTLYLAVIANVPSIQIYLRGPSITKGYFMREDLTKEAITEDGWFMTGDIGRWNPDGTLSIIDRKKNLVKLSGGEYIGKSWKTFEKILLPDLAHNIFRRISFTALEQLETIYGACNLVQKICLVSSFFYVMTE